MKRLLVISFIILALSILILDQASAQDTLKGLFPSSCQAREIILKNQKDSVKFGVAGYSAFVNDKFVVTSIAFSSTDCRGERIAELELEYSYRLGPNLAPAGLRIHEVDFQPLQVLLWPSSDEHLKNLLKWMEIDSSALCLMLIEPLGIQHKVACNLGSFKSLYNIVEIETETSLRFGRATTMPMNRPVEFLPQNAESIE